VVDSKEIKRIIITIMAIIERKVVVADDENRWRQIVGMAWMTAFRERGSEDPEVSLVNGSAQLLEEVLTKSKPDVVVLDHDYKQGDYRSWEITEALVEDMALKLGIDFNPIKKPDRGGWSMSGVMPDDLYYPSSINFGLILRYLGFTGKIVVVSSDPPEADYILRELNELNAHLKNFDMEVGSPIDAVICKPSKYHPKNFEFATKISDDTYDKRLRWTYQRIEAENFSVAVGELLKEIL